MEWDIKTGGASFEEMVSLMAKGLQVVKGKMGSLFGQRRVAISAGHYLESLLGNLPRKTGWQRAEAAGDEGAVLVTDETGFLKKGNASCGVGRQYTGSARKITNCQIGVFAAYVSPQGHAFVDRSLYFPKAWTSYPSRLSTASVPADVTFATKPSLARQMIERSLRAGLLLNGLLPIVFMGSRWDFGMQERATSWAWQAVTG